MPWSRCLHLRLRGRGDERRWFDRPSGNRVPRGEVGHWRTFPQLTKRGSLLAGNLDDLVLLKTAQFLLVAIRPAHGCLLDRGARAKAERENRLALTEVATGWHDILNLPSRGGFELYPRTDRVTVGAGVSKSDSDIVVTERLVVAE